MVALLIALTASLPVILQGKDRPVAEDDDILGSSFLFSVGAGLLVTLRDKAWNKEIPTRNCRIRTPMEYNMNNL